MDRQEKLLERIMSGEADANIRFSELCALLQRLGFGMQIRGSHHVFRKAGCGMNRAASKKQIPISFFPAKPASGGCDRSERCALATAAKKAEKSG